ncbi:glycosyltransferase [Gordonia amicalis]|uniref:glycosyltransferase n=1 Tax=Gordonia TaxID=2053 RepID=UPI001785F978|nr:MULTISPECIES: glycosyltransferase family 2 protein [Gordonia]UPW15712.1 glycosyltransferase [Gordonia amicalis]
MPKLSVIIPVLDEEDAIGPCLEAIAAQTYPVDECVVVDNNCTDRTIEIARTFENRLPLRIVAEKRAGVAWARERGFEVAIGDLLGRIDADTRLEPNWAQTVVDFFEQRPDVAAASGATYPYDVPFAGWFERRVRRMADADRGRENLYGANMVVRREDWDSTRALQLLETDLLEDVDLCLAFKKKGKVMWWLPSLVASQSYRRVKSSPMASLRYALAAPRTYLRHREYKTAAVITGLMPISLIVGWSFWIVLLPYDIKTQTWHWRNVFAGQGRVLPMD